MLRGTQHRRFVVVLKYGGVDAINRYLCVLANAKYPMFEDAPDVLKETSAFIGGDSWDESATCIAYAELIEWDAANGYTIASSNEEFIDIKPKLDRVSEFLRSCCGCGIEY